MSLVEKYISRQFLPSWSLDYRKIDMDEKTAVIMSHIFKHTVTFKNTKAREMKQKTPNCLIIIFLLICV